MELRRNDEDFEILNKELNDENVLLEYKKPFDNYRVSFVPRVLGGLMVASGNIVYREEPSYLKFRAIEVIARVPYHSWASAAYTLLTTFYTDEKKSMRLSDVAKYARLAQDNETMHVVVISQLAREEGKPDIFRHTIFPVVFAFFYFWVSYFLYLANPRYSHELNYLFEQHAFDQYSYFLEKHSEELKNKMAKSEFLEWYGRYPRNQYEFFLSVRNDEIIHRNTSVHGVV